MLIRGDKIIPNESTTYYFEICVLNIGNDGAIGIGIASGSDVDIMPGWYLFSALVLLPMQILGV